MNRHFLHDVMEGVSPEWRKAALEDGPGLAASLLLHGLIVLAILLVVMDRASHTVPPAFRLVPIDLVRLGENTTSPQAEQKAVVPQQRAAKPQQAASPTDESLSPTGRKSPPLDTLDAKLRALARLRQPPSVLKVENGQGASNVDAANDGTPGNRAAYSIRDYVRAQVERRWSLNLAKLGAREYSIPIRIVMKADGSIVLSEIVDMERAKHDALYRDVAISARNAVTLSSPIALPPGDYPKTMHMVLNLNPRDTLR